MQVSFHAHKRALLRFRPHNMGGCYCQCPLAEPGLKRAVGAELDSKKRAKLLGFKNTWTMFVKAADVSVVGGFDGTKQQVSRKCDRCTWKNFVLRVLNELFESFVEQLSNKLTAAHMN